ncbi:MAG: hypothetical protein FJ399_20505, partial [Verrucomicrobia bacterium]|nr:hypothetical protein [Verrucomicrobiota bacterium]
EVRMTPGGLAVAGIGRSVLPIPLEAYTEGPGASLVDVLSARAELVPFNVVATVIFLLAIGHTFLTGRFRHWAHRAETAHAQRRGRGADRSSEVDPEWPAAEVSFKGQVLHFLGEVEAVFGVWAVLLMGAIGTFYGWPAVLDYVGRKVSFTEPMFVVVIMAIASTRPILLQAENSLRRLVALGRGTPRAWWLTILTVAPVLGSFITEPAAMTIGALLLARQFYACRPSPRLAYATLGLLFVNVSVGGTLTHFAAPPVLMVAGPWRWDTAFMLTSFGWKAVVGIVLATGAYSLVFRRELANLGGGNPPEAEATTGRAAVPVPAWITTVQVAFLGFTVLVAHFPPLFVGGFLFFLAFAQATAHHQGRLELKSPLLVGFFLAGLVVHGGLQAWWIEPVLKRLGETPLFWGATILTAFNDNAAITYLATLVPGFTDSLKYAVVAGAVTGGGLTVIANAPNPAGQNILQRHFPGGVSPVGLVLGALPPTAIMAGCFLLL